MRRTGKNLLMLLEVQNRLKKGEVITMVTKEFPKYIEDSIEGILIEPVYNVNDQNFNGFNKRVEKKIIGYNISLRK